MAEAFASSRTHDAFQTCLESQSCKQTGVTLTYSLKYGLAEQHEIPRQFREDGRVLSYEDFVRDDAGGRVWVYGDAQKEHGLGSRTFQPAQFNIEVHDPQGPPVIRFQFAALCEHWDNARHGKGAPYVMLLHIGGVDGRNTEYRPFSTNGQVWWVDVNRQELGCPGQKVNVYAVTEFCNKDARGMSYETWNNKTAYSCHFDAVAMWQLV